MTEFMKVFFTLFGIGMLSATVPWGSFGLMAGAQSVLICSLACTALYFKRSPRQRKVCPIPDRQFYVLLGVVVAMYLVSASWIIKGWLE